MKTPPSLGRRGFLERDKDLKKRSVNNTIKVFYSRPGSFAFALPKGHRVHATPGDNLHSIAVKGFSNDPFPLS